jgi:outer membrane protein OmpA-like peptidoglycan-associated protein
MHKLILLVATGAVLALVPPWPDTGARAQATIDPRALVPLGPGPATPEPAPKASQKPRPQPAADPHAHANGPHQRLPQPPQPPAKPSPAKLPLVAPPGPVLPPPLVVPTRPVEPPPPPPIVKDAAGIAAPAPGATLRVTFGVGSADLNAETDAAVRALAQPSGSSYALTAYAAGTPDDPSTARRLALARAIAVRSVLINAGVASPHVYVRALGAAAPEIAAGPPDRVDILVTAPAPAQKAVP